MWLFDECYALLIRFHPFAMGATFALSAVASILFLRFYQKSRDRLLLFFSAAFGLLAFNRIAFQFTDSANETQPVLYAVRLLAFCLIIFSIIDKNRKTKARKFEEKSPLRH